MSKFCRKCGNELKDDMIFCNKCGTKYVVDSKVNSFQPSKERRMRFKVSDVVNEKNVYQSTNRVAFIANGWALKVRNRGILVSSIIIIISFILMVVQASESVASNGDDTSLLTLGMGLLYAFIAYVSFNTLAFIIRMGAEIIQLLDDIKNRK